MAVRFIGCLFVWLAWSTSAWAAIAFDAVGGGTAETANTVSWTHTVVSDDNGAVFVGVSSVTGDNDVSSATYGGSAMTLVSKTANESGVVALRAVYYYLPSGTGASTVSVTVTGAASDMAGVSLGYTGVHQTTIIGTAVRNGAWSGTATATVTSATGELVLGFPAAQGSGISLVPGTGTTERGEQATGTANADARIAGGDEAGAASVVIDWTLTSRPWSIIAVPIKPAAASTYSGIRRRR